VPRAPLPDPALSIQDLTVRYAGSTSDAVSGASLEVGAERVVIVGPNGCGKTTLLKAALGLTPVTRGTVRVLGHDVRTVRGEVGVGTNLAEVYRLMTIPVGGLLSLWAELKGGSDAEVRGWIDEFGLQDVLDRPLHRLSTGQTKLVGDLLALAHTPRLVLLDEPFDNVDFGRRHRYIELLRRSAAAVVMNTHELELLSAFPSWVLYFMFEGQLIGPFRAADLDRLYVSRGERPGAVATFRTGTGAFSVTLDAGEVPMKGSSNLGYLLERVA
jgi:ABC-type multidrug transport system ATPase subunit